MSCSPETPIKWSDVYAISSRIDALADALGTPAYSRLDETPDMPFKFPDLVDFSGAISFVMFPGTSTVIQQSLSASVDSTVPSALDPVLVAMGSSDDLFLTVEEDGCWCNTLFKIDTSEDVPRVKEAEETGCCQSLFVPQPGDELDYGQNIIQAAFVETYVRVGRQYAGPAWIEFPACVGARVSGGFQFDSKSQGAKLMDCTREIKSSKFTWPMRKKYMDKMLEKLKYILTCKNNGGAKNDSIRTGKLGDEQYVDEGCDVPICALVRDRVDRAIMNYSTPGCVSQGCQFGLEPSAYPWDVGTCGGSNCSQNGPRFYCRTLKDLESILDIAETGVMPFESGKTGCCCPVVAEEDVQSFGVTVCGCYYDESTICGRIVSETIYVRQTDDFTDYYSCFETCTASPVGIADASLCSINFERDPFCPPGGDDNWDRTEAGSQIASDCVSMPQCGELYDQALTLSEGASGGISRADCQNISKGNYRLTLPLPSGLNTCPSGSGAITARYKMIKVAGFIELDERVGLTATLNWSSSDGKYVSDWKSFPEGISKSDVETHGNVYWKFDLKQASCPACYTP
jgi:hypothetical protein